MRTLLFGLVFLSPPFMKKLLLRWFCGAQIKRHAHVGWFSAIMGRQIQLGDYSTIRPFTLIRLDGEIRLGSYSEISSFNLVYGSSSLIIGDHSYIGPQSLINADEPVRIGHGSALGARCMVYTHGSFLPYTEGYWAKLAGVTVGDKAWCAAGVFIHPGVEIGDDTFVNARSVVTQNVPSGSVAEGNPAKVIYPMKQVKRRMSPRRVDAVVDGILRSFAEIGLRRGLGLKAVQESKNCIGFRWQRRSYQITLIPSQGGLVDLEPSTSNGRQIFVVNRSGWSPPPGAMVFDLATMRTPFYRDGIHTALRIFMQRYYGIQFTFQGHA